MVSGPQRIWTKDLDLLLKKQTSRNSFWDILPTLIICSAGRSRSSHILRVASTFMVRPSSRRRTPEAILQVVLPGLDVKSNEQSPRCDASLDMQLHDCSGSVIDPKSLVEALMQRRDK